ncbi:hypothetical protein [Georgfuchsia toluolica]|nr:hypothetical protein [Georgfuchsia toluolica]
MTSFRGSRIRRWAHVVLRGLHIAAVIALGASMLGAPAGAFNAPVAVACSGVAILILDLWRNPDHLREVAGLAVIVKLALYGLMITHEASRSLIFWVIVAWSVIFSHAPARFRHTIILGAK